MITFISFVLIILGAVNWLSIGALQYDFVAGLFGSQASMFSRIIYFFVGIAAIWIVIQAFRGKGRIKINDDGFNKKKDVLAEEKNSRVSSMETGNDYTHRNINERDYSNHSNSEVGREYANTNNSYRNEDYYNSQGFPRDVSRYENRQNYENSNELRNNYNNSVQSKVDLQNKNIDYKSLGYKDFNEEDLDK